MPMTSPIANSYLDNPARREQTFGRNRSGGTTAAEVTRAQWQHFLDVYRPLETEVLQRAMQTDFTAEGDRAGVQAAAGLASSAGSYERNLRRAGVALSAEERNALARRRSTSRTRAVAGAENLARRGLKEQRTNLLADMVGIGRGVAQTATSGLNTIADLEAQRAVFNEQGRTAAHNQNVGMAASAAAFAIMFL